MLSVVLITGEGDITKDRSDPASAHKIALNRAEREKPVFDCCRKPIKHTHVHTREPTHTHTDEPTHTHTDVHLPPSRRRLLPSLPRAFLCVSTHLGLHSSL